MNCTEARGLLAIYRDLKEAEAQPSLHDEETRATLQELEEHLESCPDCRQALADFTLVGARLQRLPAIEPPPEMRERLMRALAAEHARFLKRGLPGTPPPPDFLKPYMQEQLEQEAEYDPLATLSTAKTGPLPVLQTPRRVQRRPRMPQLAALAVAATFLLALLTGGLTSVLLLAQHSSGSIPPPAAINHPTNVVMMRYATATLYHNVVSAAADGNVVYYSAFNDGTPAGWMLLRLDRQTQLSQPLLTSPQSSPLIVLGSAHNRLVWLQYDPPAVGNVSKAITPKKAQQSSPPRDSLTEGLRSWKLFYAVVDPTATSAEALHAQLLLSGIFNPELAAGIVHTPVPGIWFLQNGLLVTALDQRGLSHLWLYSLQENGQIAGRSELAAAPAGHIYTSPTATADGSRIFWADEWLDSAGFLHSNIWTRQEIELTAPTQGRWWPHTQPQTWLFRADGTSFRPVVVGHTFFMLNTNDGLDGVSALATPTPAASPSPQSASQTAALAQSLNSSVTPWANASIYPPSLDFLISGSLYMLSLEPTSDGTFSQLNTISHVSALQGGSTFVLWQNDDDTYGMFDVESNTFVQVGSVLSGAAFVAVNGNSAVWSDAPASTGSRTPATTTPQATLRMFSWPLSTSGGHQ
ncbi:anti-sigma factor family protein [Thermogemmatispora sp.]|uniref:anti-sigma factor family protein n=1 Tax=Thermogemmatispora sp. TaxID=1968838 RepID=UPI0035E45940